MMAILWSPEPNKTSVHNESLQYLLILCCKVALNTLILSFWMRSIHKSFLGLCSISVYVADALLVGAITCACFLREHLPTSTSMCFILAHGSAIYALLPLPILIAGAFDYATYPHLVTEHSSQRRTVIYCITVAVIWASVCVYSYHHTNTRPTEIYKDKEVRVLVCHVQGSNVVFHFSAEVSIVVGLILLLYSNKLIGWTRRANEMEQRYSAFDPEKQQYLPDSLVGEDGNWEIQESSPPLFASLTLGFAVNWMPYLFMCVACDLLGCVVPAYASVNLLWMACANSLLVGIAFWHMSDKTGHFSKFPDDICLWSIYWHLSKGTSPTVAAKLSKGLHILTTSPSQEVEHSRLSPVSLLLYGKEQHQLSSKFLLVIHRIGPVKTSNGAFYSLNSLVLQSNGTSRG
ncbi:probable G-protein coupled receptor 160 isoform X2 [Myxocyprinus asiaticus]|nr:probable G-protein coupled receptor 160 isoform X2 [Myxocyprinus asiaticus]